MTILRLRNHPTKNQQLPFPDAQCIFTSTTCHFCPNDNFPTINMYNFLILMPNGHMLTFFVGMAAITATMSFTIISAPNYSPFFIKLDPIIKLLSTYSHPIDTFSPLLKFKPLFHHFIPNSIDNSSLYNLQSVLRYSLVLPTVKLTLLKKAAKKYFCQKKIDNYPFLPTRAIITILVTFPHFPTIVIVSIFSNNKGRHNNTTCRIPSKKLTNKNKQQRNWQSLASQWRNAWLFYAH